MISFLSIIVLGFFLGMRHATDPDHVIAVTTIVSQQREVKYGAMIGAIWGVGHTLTILLVGSAIILFNLVIPPRLGLAMEVSVGMMLIFLGLLNIFGMVPLVGGALNRIAVVQTARQYLHPAGLNIGECWDVENHDHATAKRSVAGMSAAFREAPVGRVLRPLAVGIVHGLAGSAAVALLLLTTIRSPYGAVAYLLVFGIGTIAGMMMITALIAVPFALSNTRFTRINHGLGILSAVASLCFGAFVVYQMGFMSGLFSSAPRWVPR